MKTPIRRKIMSLLLSVVMLISLLPAQVFAADGAESTWTSVEWADITADDTIAITMTKDSTTWVLPTNGGGSNGQPLAQAASVNDDGKLVTAGAADICGWTRAAEGDGYTLTTASGSYLYVTAANNGVRIGSTAGVFKLSADGYLTSEDSKNATRYLGVYNGTDWRCYTEINSNIAGQTIGFWKLEGSTPGGDEPVEPEDPADDVLLGKLTEAPADGSQLVIYHPASGTAMTATASGAKLAGTAATVSEDLLTQTDDMALLIAHEADGQYTFELAGQYLTSAATGNGLSFADDGESDLAKWTLEQQTDGTWYVKSVGAAYNGNHNQALEYYNGFTTYGVKTDNAAYKFEFYGVLPNTDPVSGLKTGDKVAIFNDGNAKALTATASGTRLAGADAALNDEGKLTGEGIALFTVTVDDNGYLTFANEGKYLTSGATGSSLTLADTESDYSLWVTEDAGDGLFFVKNVNAAYNGGAQYLEYYNTFTTYGKKATAAATAYAMSFRQLAESTEPEEPTGDSFGLTATLATGDEVILYNPNNGVALGNSLSNYKVAGVALTPAEGVITTDKTAVVWTVTVNDDGTYTFTQGDYTLGGTVRESGDKTYNNIALTEAQYVNWTLTGPDSNLIHFLSLAEMTSSFGGTYLEYYNGFTLYGSDAPTADAFGIQFYKKNAEPDTPPEPTGDTFGLSSTLATGDEVILFNAKNGVGLGNTIASHKITGVALTPSEGVITTDNTAVVWTVTANTDGTYTFTQGDYTLGGVVSGTYNNLVVTDATSTGWTLTGPDSSDFNYFLSLNDMATNYGHLYLEYYNGFTLYGSTAPDKDAYGITFYKKGAEPETPAGPGEAGDLVTSLDQLTDGATVAIYSPGHKTAISTKPNGDWYLKANNATVENGKVVNFTEDFVWTVKKNSDGTFSFYANGDESRSITVWKSDTYAELSLNVATYPDNTWTLTPAKTANCFYASSPTVSGDRGPAYIEAYVRNEFEVFSGYFTSTSSNKFTESEFALQFYLVNPDDAVAAIDDGEWDGVLDPTKQYVAYNATAAASIGLFAEANYSMRAIPTTIEGGKANAGNGAYVFTVDSMGRYYTFKVGDKFFATNASEELLFVEPNEDGSAPETAKWFLQAKDGGYIIYNKEATYNGTPVCVEYYSSVFSGWTFSTKNDVGIYLFNFYEVADGTEIRDNVVQAPSVIFDCEDSRYVEQDYTVSFSLDDLAESINAISITYTAGSRTGSVEDYEVSSDGKSYSFTIPAGDIDGDEILSSFTVNVSVTNSYDITYTGEKTVEIIDEPFFSELTPAPNSQTREDKRPAISARIGNVGEDPTFTMTVNGQAVEAAFENGVLSYTPAADMTDGRVTVSISVTRADGVKAEKTWNFTVGIAEYQLYFGQLHSHTTYSDGSGSLDTALEYIASLPESANVQFVAFTDHSNYFDTTSAANPADALNDKSLMTDASRALWEEYKGKVAAFNASHDNLLAIAGFEMTWSGGPGHINTFDSDGLVSRNNAELNNKTSDAGMKLYYETMNKGDSLNQFNHPGTTFGNFTDFSYRDDATDEHMFLVEVGNGEGQIGAGGYYPSYEQYILALDKGWHVAPTNNQDNHKGRWGNANDARDVILTNDFSEQGIYDAIRALRVYATEDKNLQINYTVNDEPMGTIFSDENTPEQLNVLVSLFDPDASDSVTKVEIVADGGKTVYTWDNSTELAAGQLSAELAPDYSYYFIRVTQKDGDLAVTAPVWVGHAVKLGITDIKAQAEKVYVDQEATLVTTLFNNEETAATVKSLVYTVNGGEVIGTDTTGYTLAANGTLSVNFAHTFDKAKLTTVTVTAVVELDGKEYTYTANVELDVLDPELENQVTPIADVRAASDPADTGYRFVIEGVVTSNASGFDKDTAFFDCIYVQDDTAGICCFPVSGEYKIGDKVRIVGHTDFYQGEPELQVETIEIIGADSVEPTEITASELNDRSAEGKLVTIKGTVESIEEANGLIQTILVKDAAGGLARVFIDGYITTGTEVENCVVGASISATGLASYDDTWPDTNYFPRIRIRDRADVVCSEAQQLPIVKFYGSSLSLDGEIAINFYLVLPDDIVSDPDSYYFTLNTTRLSLADAKTLKQGDLTLYGFKYRVDAKRMGMDVTLRVYNSEGTVLPMLRYSNEADVFADGYTYSAQRYIQQTLATSTNAKLIALVEAMSDFGSLAQKQFNYDVANAAALYHADDIAAVTAADLEPYKCQKTETARKGIEFSNMTLVLEAETTMKLFFKLNEGEIGDYTFTVDGKAATATETSSGYVIEVKNIAAKNLDKFYKVVVRDSQGVCLTVNCTALNYSYLVLTAADQSQTLIDLVKSIYLYNKAANTYFAK